jgi:hypothetical protein
LVSLLPLLELLPAVTAVLLLLALQPALQLPLLGVLLPAVTPVL